MGASFKVKRRYSNHSYFSDDWWFKSAIKWFFFILLAFILQTKISLFGYPLNFTVLVVYAFVLHSVKKTVKKDEFPAGGSEIKCTIFGAFIGIIDDIISGSMLGSSFLSLGLVGFFGSILFTNVLFRWTPLLGIIVIFIFAIFSGLAHVALRILFTDINISIYNAIQMIFIQAFINMPFGALLKPSKNY